MLKTLKRKSKNRLQIQEYRKFCSIIYPQKGIIQAGADADIVIWKPDYEQRLTYTKLAHACDNTPFEGMAVSGLARDVILGGEIAVQNGTLQKKGLGKFVHRGPCMA